MDYINILVWITTVTTFLYIVEKYLSKKAAFENFIQSLVPVTVEEHDNVFFWYNSSTSDFIGQGSDYEEIISKIKHKLSGKTLVIGTECFISEFTDWEFIPFEQEKNK